MKQQLIQLHIANYFTILLFLGLYLPPSVLEAQTCSGTVFRDFNGNGVKDTNEPGVLGVTVKAYNAAGTQVGSTATSAVTTGAWSITTSTTATVRVEFQIPTNGTAQDYTAESGVTYGSSVQFVAGNATGVNFGINYPDDYWNNTTQPIPQLVIPCYVGGSITGANKDEPAIVQLGNNQNGLSVTKKVVAKVSEVGTVWGTAFQKSKDRFFLGSFLKRHSGFGPLGTGGVYMVEKVSGNYAVAGSFNLQGVTPSNGGSALDMGSVIRVTTPATADNYLANSTTNKNEPGRDLDAFAKIGKISFGDVEMDEANSQLVLVNLFNRQLITVNVSGGTSGLNGASSATLGPLTKAYNIMSLSGIPSCVAGDLRPWGLKIYKGKGYLGVVCNGNDGVSTRSIDNVKGYVLQFDPQNIAAGFTQVLTLNLKYTLAARWKPWADTWAQTGLPTGGVAIGNTHLHHQPILSDIDFDENGGMIIALLDRFGHQIGYENYLPVSGSTITDSGGGYGDILYACYNSSTGLWTMEGGSGCPPANTHNGASEGYAAPGTLEYFSDISGDNYPDNSMGAVTKVMGTGNVVSVVVDPHPATFTSGASYWNTGGIQWHNTSTGLHNQYAQIYNVGVDLFLYGKADGLGDIEPALNLAPIEIGNRVWKDTDKDGIQDADEQGIGNVAVELCADFDNDGNCDIISSPPVSGSATNTTATGAAVSCGGLVAWSSPTSANSVNGTGATAALTSTNTTTHCLQITGMGFSIPTNATIRGVTAAVTRNASIVNAVIDQNIQLIVGGTATGDNKADWTTKYPTTFTAATYGSSIDIWNTALTPAQVNATNFGINIRSGWVTGTPTARIDGVVITVYYTTPGSSTTVMATTTTSSTAGNSLGTWYFNTSNVIDGDPTVSGNQPGLATGKKYLVRIGSADWTGGVGTGDLANLTLTTADATPTAGLADESDNDATLSSAIPTIAYTTGSAGQNNHTLDFGFITPPCNIVLTPSVSDCYDSNGNTAGGSSVATVQAIVDWANNPSGETINVTCTGATAQNIDPSTSSKPAILTFTVPANGGAVAVTATFSTTTTCTATQNVTAPTGTCLLTPCEAGNTGGTVWRDFNNDGVKDGSETQGVSGVTVKVYDCNGTLVATTTTDYLGQYTFTTLTPSTVNKYRIEFSNIPPQYKPTFNGTNGRTDVQFISAASCTVNLGLNSPVDYCQTNPRYVLPCYVNGLTTGNAASDAALVSVPYASTGLNSAYSNYDGTQGTGPAARVDALISQIGSVWGEAYHQTQKHLYFGTFLKRHVGMADGPGYIYNFDYNGTTPTYTGKFDLQGAIPNNGGAAIDLGTVCRSAACAGSGTGIAADYTLPTSKLTPNVDLDAFGKVATMSFGDLEIQPNTDYLWAVNLYQKALIRLNVSGNPTSLPSDIEQYILSSLSGYPSSTTGILRPWALKFNDGKGYLGVVADASISGLQTDLRAYVLQFDPNNIGAGFTQVLNFDPNIKKDTDPIQAPLKFQKWVSSYAVPPMNTYNISGVDYAFYPQPVLSDIEFDGAGNMYLSFLDRAGHQLGYDNYTAESQSTSFIRGLTFGELLKACNSNAIWSIEGLNSCHTGTEFFQDIMGDGNPEASEGALALMKSNNQLLNVSVDPHPQGVTGSPYYATQGTMTYNLSTGVIDNWYSVYYGNNPLFGKANGLGDVEFLCNAAPIQIGNYVWQDINKDGVQDPCEAPLSNVTVSLWKGGTQIASTTTDANGEYYFSDKNAAGVTWTGTGADTSLLPSMAYEVRIDTTNQTTLDTLKLTTANATANAGNDQNDSDASVTGNYAVISFTTGVAGSTNHTLDFGFSPTCDTTLTVTNTTICNGATVDLFAQASGVKGTLTYSTNGTTWTALTSPTNITPSVTTTYYIKDTLTSGCFDIDTLVITVNSAPTTPSVSSPIMNVCPLTTVDLTTISAALAPSVSGGVFEWHVSNSSSSALVSNQNTVVVGDYYLFERSPAGCYSVGLKVTVAIQVCCPTKNCLPVTVTRN